MRCTTKTKTTTQSELEISHAAPKTPMKTAKNSGVMYESPYEEKERQQSQATPSQYPNRAQDRLKHQEDHNQAH